MFLNKLSNQNIAKKVVVGVAAVALFAPVALGGTKAHASDLDNAMTPEASEKSAQQAQQVAKERDAWANAHPIHDPDTAWNTGSHAEDNIPSSAGNKTTNNSSNNTNQDASSNKNSNQGYVDNSNSTNDYMSNGSQNNNSNSNKKSHTSHKANTDNVKYPNTPKKSHSKKGHSKKANNRKFAKKIIKLHKKGLSNKKIAKKLGIHVSIVKHVIK